MADTFDPMTARLEDAPSTAKKDEFDPSTATLEKPRTWGEAAKDTGAAVMGGLAGLAKTAGDLYGLAGGGMDNALSEAGRNAQEYWSDAKSQALQTKIAQRKANIDAQESTLGKAWTAVKDTLTDPALAADTVAENVATMLPGAGVGRAVGAAKYARGFQAASEFGPASLAAREAIAKQAGKYATGAAIGTGAVQQGADVSSDIYGDLMKKTDAEWDASPDFQSALQRHGGDRQAAKNELANATARAAFLPAAGISVAANAIPGATYLERALVGAPLRTGAKEVGRFGAARGFARGVLGEGGQEFVEEGGGRLGANLAAQQQAMPGHDTWDGVGENAGMGFAGGALLGVGGGIHGAREAMAQKRAQGQAKQNQPAKDDGTQSDVPTGMPPDASGGGAAPVEDAGNAGLSAPLGSGVTPDMLVPANPLLDAMRQRATDPGVIAPPINKDEIFDQSAATPVAGELYQPGDTTNPLTGERIPAKPSEAMGINPADGPLSTGAAIAVDTGASGQMQQAAALAEAVKAAPKTPAGEAKTAAPDLSGWSDQQLSDTFRAAQAPNVRRQLAVELQRRRDVREQQALQDELRAEQDGAAPGAENADQAFARTTEDAGGAPSDLAPIPSTPKGRNEPQADQAQQAGAQPAQAPQQRTSAQKPGAVAANPKAIERVNAGRAFFFSEPKAQAFIDDNGLSGTHELEQRGKSWHVVESPKSEATKTFAPETGTLGVPRSEMPQVPSQSHGALVNHLNAQGIAHETTTVDAGSLKPTQAEYSPAKVEDAKTAGGDRAVIVSSDGHIIDGHHQAVAAAEEGKPVKAIVLDAPIDQALAAVKASPSAQKSGQPAVQLGKKWTPEVGGEGNTIWTRKVGKDRYTATFDPDAGTMEVTTPVNLVDTQIASFKVESAEQAARLADAAVDRDVAETAAASGKAPKKPRGILAKKAEADAARATAQPTHQDPGQSTEVATQPVVAESVQKAARSEGTKPSEMRKWLLGEIDKELLQAPDRADYDEAVKRLGEKDAIRAYTGNGPLGKGTETGLVTFDVPGDGKFKVLNSVRRLLEFRRKVSSSGGFKNTQSAPRQENDGVQRGSSSQAVALNEMVNDGDFEAARDYAQAVGLPLESAKPNKERGEQWEAFLKDGTLPVEVRRAETLRQAKTAPTNLGAKVTPQIASAQALRGFIGIAADSIDKLRAVDVDRVISEAPAMYRVHLADHIRKNRPDLAQEVDEALAEAKAEAKKPKDTGWNMAGTGYAGKRYIGRNITTDDGREIVARVYENAGVYEEAEVKVDGVRKFTVTDRYNAQDKADAFIKTLMAGEKLDLKGFERIPKGNGYFDLRDGNMTVSVEPMGQGKYQASFRGAKSSPHLIGEQGAVDWAANYREESQRADAKTKDKAKPFTPPAGYKPAGEPFYRGGKLVQGYAPFAPGERVTMKDSAGQSGVVEGLIKPDDNGVFESAAVRFDNGTSQAVLLGKLEATTEKAALDATGPRRDPAKVSMFNPYEDGDIVTINGQDWTVKQDTPGWYLTTTGNWRGQHPTIRNVKAMADLIREVEQASVARKAAEIEPETPKLTQAEAKSLMEWQDLGQKDGVKTHALTFYESQADKDAKRGRMIVAKVSKGDRSANNWMVEGDDKPLAVLGMAKKRAEEIGMAKAVADGFVEPAATKPAAAPQPAAPAAPIDDFGEKLEGARKDMPPSLKEEVSDEKIASLPLSKIWPSDAHESIEDDAAAALVFAARQEIPAKPRVPSRVRAWVSKVKTYRTLVKDLGKNSLERIEQLSKEKGFHSLDPFFAKVRLLSQLPRDTWSRVERVEEYPNAIRYEKDGSKTAVAFSSVTIDGKSRRFDGVGKIGPDEVQAVKEMLGTAAPKKDGLTAQDFEVRGTAKTGYKINRKGDSEYRPLKIFTGEDAAKKALAWRDEHTAELEAAWEAVKARDNVSKAEIRRDENRERTGENRRNGRDVTAQMFTDAFGFRGAQFGNWVGQGADAKSRQGMLNDAYDALLDLSDILGIQSRAISLNGTLGLSFGARGSGKAAAHFEPSNLVINLTKTRGAGSLAHEWFHALDNYFSRMRGGEVAFTGDNNAYRQNNYVTYKPEAAWGKAPITPYTNFMRGGQLRERLQRLPGFTYDANKTLAENAKAAGFERDPSHKDGVRPQVEKAFADLVQALNDSPMAKRASSLDKAADGYWGRIIERGARSFENYVISKMAQRGWSNDFLANIRSFDEWMAMGKNAERYPYLKPEEDAPVVAAFDKLFETVETKEDDTGNVALFSFAGQQAATADTMALATAQQRLEAGEDAEAVRQDTGWFKGNDGRMRFEISDNEAKVDMALLANLHRGGFAERGIEHVSYRQEQDGTYSLTLAPKSPQKTSDFVIMRGIPENLLPSLLPQSALDAIEQNHGEEDMIGPNLDDARRVRAPFQFRGFNALPLDVVMDHPKLFAAYPALREIMVQVDPKLGSGASFAVTDYVDGTVRNVISIGDPLAKDVDSALLHEIQHGIQAIEGFATGGTPQSVASILEKERFEAMVNKDDALTAEFDALKRQYAGVPESEIPQEVANRVRQLRSEINAIRNTGWREASNPFARRQPTPEELFAGYTRLAGEVEARNTQARQKLTAEQRRATSPSQTADVADADVIVVFNGKEMANAPMPANAAPDAATTVQPLRTPAATIRAAITKAYGKLLGQLESKGLVTLTQTQEQAIEAAAQARAAKTGQSVERERARLHASIRGEADELSMSIYSDEAGKIERALEAMGLQVSTEGSRISQSTYVIVESPEYTQTEGESGSVLKIRVSDHRLPGGYQQPDFEVQVGNAHQGVDMADAAGAWFDAVRWVGRRFGVEPKGAAKRQIAAAAEKEAKAKQAAVAAADQQRNSLDTSKARLQAWLQSLPDGALWGNARRGGWVAVLDGKMIGRFDGETATGEGQPWYGGPYPVEAQKNLQPVRESLRASVKNSVADQTQTENFQRWFKDSKVVDAEGKPLRVYHGTTAEISAFQQNKAAEKDAGWYGRGIYFTADPDTASTYSRYEELQGKELSGAPRVMPVYVSIQNPYVWPANRRAATTPEEAAAIRKELEAQGHDGVIVPNEYADPRYAGHYEVVAFRPEQIKSAIGNNGNFDPNDPDIRRSANGAIQGFFDPQTGQSFLIADNLTAEAAPGVMMHEVGIHMAADGSMNALFNRAAMMLKLQKGNPFIKAVQARMDAAGETSGEEAAAYIAEAYENDRANAPASVQRWLADLLAAVKAWMFKKGIMGADSLTVADVAAVARANARSMAQGDAMGSGGAADIQFSRPGTTQDKAVMRAIADGKSTRDVLRLIASSSKNPFNRQVARLLLKAGVTPDIVFGHIGKRGADGIHGQYRGKTDTIHIAGSAEYAAERIFLHEAMHAATMRALRKNGLHSIQLRKLFERVSKQKSLAGFYGIKNVDEFVVEVFTNPDFQQALRNISAPSGSVLKTAWDSFVRILRSILGLGNDTHSALSQALNLGVSVVREDMLIRKKGTRMGMRAEGGVDPDAKAAVALQQRVEGMSAQELAQFLASDNTPAQAAIARRVSERLTALQKQGVKFDFKVSHIGAFAPAAMNRARAYTEFEVDDKGQISVTVWAHGADMQGRVGMDKGTLLHELVHAVTGAALQAGRMHPDSAYRQSVGDLRKLHAALVEHIIDRRKRMGDGISEFEKSILEGANNAMQSEDEILAWGLTNPEMQSLLESMPYQGATGWGRFVQTIRNLLGLAPSADTGLSEVLRIADQIMSADPVETSELPNIAKSGMPMYSTQGTARRWGMAEQDGDGHVANFGTDDMARNIGDGLKSITVPNVKRLGKHKLTDWLKMGLQFLGRRQLVDIYGDMLPMAEYDRLAAQMDADKNESGAEADKLVTRWAKLPDEGKLADLMHEATLAQIDPAKPYVDGDDKAKYAMLAGRFNALSQEAKQVYTDTRDAYQAHHAKVRSAIKERIERSELKGPRKAELLKRMDDEFFAAVKGVYFPLARFGQYAVTVKGPDGKVESVSRAETKAEAEALRNNLLSAFPRDKGFTVGRVMLSKDFIADRDAVGRGFMTELYQVLDKQDMDAAQRAELEDTLGQLYLSSLPDLSWAKHGIHRKGTPGFSQDARRAFAQNMFHGARYLAKLRYSDLMQDQLAAMQKHVDDWREVEDFDQNSAQRVVDEMNKRHESLMNPKSNPLSTALTSLGFVFHLGLSPASAMVNLSQTALVAYPIMGAKWGFGKASAALLKASKQAAAGKNDITGSLNADERAAYDEAVRAGTIDVTMAHDLAGIAQGEDAGVMWKIRPVMRWASFLFHHAERFNRQVTFVAAYRLAREAGADNKAAFEQATKATYDGHFDYSASNRARIMQGNVAKVLLLFKQYGQNMVYTLSRNAYQSINGTDAEKAEARKVLAGLLTSHAMAAGVLGLPMVTTLLAAASMIGGDDDEPWDAKVALQNLLADTFGQKPAEVLAHGLSRLTPWDISGRVGLDRLIFPDVQEGLEGQRLAESAMAAALGPVAGIGVNMLKGAQHMSEGRYALGLEAMLPSALRGPVKAIRYANEGVQDKSGISILDEVSPAAVAGQALGFSPSQARNAQEGKSAVMAHDRALGERRQELLTKAARATMAKDAEARAEAMKEIERFNQKNPTRRITPLNVLQSVRNRNKRIDQAQDGVYLPRNRRDAMDAGRFAFAGTD